MRIPIPTLHKFIFISLLVIASASSDKKIQLQQNDGRIIITALQKKEGILTIHASTDSLAHAFQQMQNKLNHELTKIELFKLFGQTVSKIQCGHTSIFPSRKVLKEWIFLRKSLPLDYTLIGKKLYVKSILKEDLIIINSAKQKNQIKTIPKDSEIISIDNKSVSEMMEVIGQYLSSDEDGAAFKYHQASQLFEFYRTISFPLKDSIEVVYSEKRDTSKIVLYTGIPPIKTIEKRYLDFIKKSEYNQTDIGKFSILKNKYAYFKFTSFKTCFGKKYEEFLVKSFTEIKKKKITKLLIDLRGNNGGQMQFSFMRYIVGPSVYLGKYQVNKPYIPHQNKEISKLNADFKNHKKLTRRHQIYKSKYPDFDGQIITDQLDDKLQFKGKIVVITDEATFSAASILACHLKTLAKAKIVGQTAGGSFYKGNAGTLKVKLPYTNMLLMVNPNTFYTQLVDSTGTNTQQIKIPDLIIDPINPKMNKKEQWIIDIACKAFQ